MSFALSFGSAGRTGIMRPYERRSTPGPFKQFLFYSALIGVAAFYGLLCSVLPFAALVIPLVPLLIMSAMVLWLLPSVDTVDHSRMATFLLWYAALNAMWPNYVAVNLPGLPWITPSRFALFGLTLVFLYIYSVSNAVRTTLQTILATTPAIKWAFWIFWICTTVSIVFSKAISESVTKYANNQIYWTMIFMVSCLLAYDYRNIGKINKILQMLVLGAIVTSVFSLFEYHYERIVWLDYLPGILKPSAEQFERLGVSNARAYTDAYRVTGNLGNPLYYAEALAISLPFVLDQMVRQKGTMRFGLMLAGFMLVSVAIYFTGSRTGMVGLLLTPVLYILASALRWRRRQPTSLVATSLLFAYPMFVVLLGLLVVFWRRLHVLVIGGGQHQASSDARATQWAMGIPKFTGYPFGHGPGQSGTVLGFFNPGRDNLTVDSYYLTLLLDYGFIGFLAFMMFFLSSAAHAVRYYFKANDEQQLILLPIGVAIVNFVVIKAVASTEVLMPVTIMLAGFAIGIAAHIIKNGAGPAPGRA